MQKNIFNRIIILAIIVLSLSNTTRSELNLISYTHELYDKSKYTFFDIDTFINTEFYSRDSFRQINSVLSSNMYISSKYDMKFVDKNLDVWANNNIFPTTKLNYAYNAEVEIELSSKESKILKNDLLEDGFYLYTKSNNKFIYRRLINHSGVIDLYPSAKIYNRITTN